MFFPLRYKLALVASLLLVGGIGLATYVSLRQSAESLEGELRKRGEFMAKNLAETAKDSVLLEEDLFLEQRLAALLEEPNILAARFVDATGRVIAEKRLGSSNGGDDLDRRHSRLTVKGERNTHSATVGGRLVNGAIVMRSVKDLGDFDIGEVQVVMDLDAAIADLTGPAQRKVALAAGALLLLGFVLAMLTSSRITRPLSRMRMAVNALAAGDRTARVAVHTRDELGVLAKAFNDMGESLYQKGRIESAFRRYVSDHVLREVIDTPEAVRLAGERREVTVLYIDIRKFTRITSWLGPERLVAFLNETFDLITSRLLEHGATVDKYIGDAILAYTGAPIISSDHTRRAVAAAIAVQRSVEERNRKCESTGQTFTRMEVGIGIHCGSVVLGNIGSELKMDFTAIGEPVNIANRLQALAEPGRIMITEDVRERVADLIRTHACGPQHLPGVEEPIDVYEVRFQDAWDDDDTPSPQPA